MPLKFLQIPGYSERSAISLDRLMQLLYRMSEKPEYLPMHPIHVGAHRGTPHAQNSSRVVELG
jgi:hypothetical protein